MENKYLILAGYHFTAIEECEREVKRWLLFLETLDAKGRIYLSEDGINVQMSILASDYSKFEIWLKADDRFKEMEIKIHEDHEHAFAKLTVKYRSELAALGPKIDLSNRGQYLTPNEWKKKLNEADENTIVVDVRNHYEWEVGHFEGAIDPHCETFREFPQFADKLKETYDVEKTVVMIYCTGGIRCELFSPLLKEKGFKHVYQLKGGVIKYGLEEGCDHWKGNLFVFDDRLVVPITQKRGEVISTCLHCKTKMDTYYNCANMDCNELFICCPKCAKKWKGCCSDACINAKRRRPFIEAERPKPFRKLPFEEKQALSDSRHS